MVLDFVKDVFREQQEFQVKKINKFLNPKEWTDREIEAFLLGYNFGVWHGR